MQIPHTGHVKQLKVFKACRVCRVFKVYKDVKVYRVFKVYRVYKVCRVSKVYKVCRVSKDLALHGKGFGLAHMPILKMTLYMKMVAVGLLYGHIPLVHLQIKDQVTQTLHIGHV